MDMSTMLHRAGVNLGLLRCRVECWIKREHLWDSQRPGGTLHQRDICWRCEKVRDL